MRGRQGKAGRRPRAGGRVVVVVVVGGKGARHGVGLELPVVDEAAGGARGDEAAGDGVLGALDVHAQHHLAHAQRAEVRNGGKGEGRAGPGPCSALAPGSRSPRPCPAGLSPLRSPRPPTPRSRRGRGGERPGPRAEAGGPCTP